MLILTRRISEEIRVGSEIRIAILGVRGNQVKVGIEAPRGIAVDREEVFQRKERERAKSQAAGANGLNDGA